MKQGEKQKIQLPNGLKIDDYADLNYKHLDYVIHPCSLNRTGSN